MYTDIDKEVLKRTRNAIVQGDLELLKELLENDRKLFECDTVFGSWLHVAVKEEKIDVIMYLLESGMDVNKKGGMAKGNAISEAARKGNIDILDLLYRNGGEFDVSDALKNPLFSAISYDNLNVVKYLVEKGIDITIYYNTIQLGKISAYEYAKIYGKTEIANYLKAILDEM